MLRPHSLLTNLIIDYEIVGAGERGAIYHGSKLQRQQTCDDAFVYISDSASAAILVYDVRNDTTWRVFHPTMLPHPDYSTYTVSMNSTPTHQQLGATKWNCQYRQPTHLIVPLMHAFCSSLDFVVGTVTSYRHKFRWIVLRIPGEASDFLFSKDSRKPPETTQDQYADQEQFPW